MEPNKRLETFRKWFGIYQRRFGLTHYVAFQVKPLEDCYATLTVNTDNHIATATINDRVHSTFPRPVKCSAKHEAIHLLIDQLENVAYKRYTTQQEIHEAVEALVVTLEKLIPD